MRYRLHQQPPLLQHCWDHVAAAVCLVAPRAEKQGAGFPPRSCLLGSSQQSACLSPPVCSTAIVHYSCIPSGHFCEDTLVRLYARKHQLQQHQAFIFAAPKALMCRPDYSLNCNCSALSPSFLKHHALYLWVVLLMASSSRRLAKPVAGQVSTDRTSTQEPPSLVLFKPTWWLHAEEGFRCMEGASQKDFSCGLLIEIQVPSSLSTLSWPEN